MSGASIPERRFTRQRSVILEVVQHSHAHPDAEEVYKLARKKIKSLSLGTVYRNLKLLVEEGQIREVQLTGKTLRYDGMLEEHEHFLCTKCNRIIDLPRSMSIKSVNTNSHALSGCQVIDYRLDLYGLCADCIQRGQNKKS